MANQKQLAILRKGVNEWNKWRAQNNNTRIDLFEADLNLTDLTGVDFHEAYLRKAGLCRSNLRHADLQRADLSAARLIGSDLSYADLRWADLRLGHLDETSLIKADLTDAKLSGVDCQRANLSAANLSGAMCISTNFSIVILSESIFRGIRMHRAIFRTSDLSEVIGLDEVDHSGPSYISADTFAISKGKIPEAFLRGCGLSDWEIASVKLYNPELSNSDITKILYKMYDLRAGQAVQISPLFISYSHQDKTFVDKLEVHLNKNGVRFWRDIHDAKAGRLEIQIDQAIKQNPTVLLILSEHSLKSDWVEHEVREARKIEQQMGNDVLCPIALDDSWKSSPWPERVMDQIMEYNILDFSAWQDEEKFDEMFRKLIDGLELFYK
jgi:uncharacterized protein YjbI with pentapeptide repeats